MPEEKKSIPTSETTTQPENSEKQGMTDIYMHEWNDEEPITDSERSMSERMFMFSRIILYIILGLSALGPIQALRKSTDPGQGIFPIMLYPLLIFLHIRLVNRVQSEFANDKDYLVGGMLLLFVAIVITIFSFTVSFPVAIVRYLGLIVAAIHIIFSVEVLKRYK